MFTGAGIIAGQRVFLKYGLMENGTVWGHGAYLGPDFSAAYLHTLALDAGESVAQQRYDRSLQALGPIERGAVEAQVQQLLKQNRYDARPRTLSLAPAELLSYRNQIARWTAYFSQPAGNAGLPAKYIQNAEELRNLTAFFAWTAWASVTSRPGVSYSYTNNFPYDPTAGNTPTRDAVLWSALSLIALLGGTAVVLFARGKFDYMGWKGREGHVHPQTLRGTPTDSQQATLRHPGCPPQAPGVD